MNAACDRRRSDRRRHPAAPSRASSPRTLGSHRLPRRRRCRTVVGGRGAWSIRPGSEVVPAGGARTVLVRPSSNRNKCVTRTQTNDNAVMKPVRATSRRSGVGDQPARGLAERVGFEPTDHLAVVNALAGRPIRPLWHLSGAGAVYANTPMNGTESAGKDFINLCDGTVAERTNAAALKAAGRKARGFESLRFCVFVVSTRHYTPS